MVATLLNGDDRDAERSHSSGSAAVALGSDAQRAFGIISRGIHTEGEDNGAGFEPRDRFQCRLKRAQPPVIAGALRKGEVEVHALAGAASGLVGEPEVVREPPGTRVDVY